MADQITIDHVSEDATRSAVDLDDSANGLAITSVSFPRVEFELQVAEALWNGSQVSGRRPKSVEISVKVRVTGTSTANFATRLGRIENKIGLLASEGGTLRRTPAGGNYLTWDVEHAEMSIPEDQEWMIANRFVGIVELFFLCHPLARGAVQTYSAASENTLPALVFTAGTVNGSVPGLGRLTVTDTQSVSRAEVWAGVQQRYYDSGTTAALFYQAEALTPASGATAVARGGNSGGTVVQMTNVIDAPQVALRTPMVGGAVPLTHKGDFRMLVRHETSHPNSEQLYMAVEYAVGGSQRWTRLDSVALPMGATWGRTWTDLGVLSIQPVVSGTHRWEGRILVWSDGTSIGTNPTVYLDCLCFMPVGEGFARAANGFPSQASSVITARDDFNQSAGTLGGKTADVGGNWTSTGTGADFQVFSSTHVLQRDTITGDRRATLDLNMTNTAVRVDLTTGDPSVFTGGDWYGVTLRDNGTTYAWAALRRPYSDSRLYVYVGDSTAGLVRHVDARLSVGTEEVTIQAVVLATGEYYVWVWLTGQQPPAVPQVSGWYSAFATGGSLATGDPGLYDVKGAGAATRYWDNFRVWVPSGDYAVWAGRSAQWRHDGFVGQDSAGVAYSYLGDHTGTGLFVPPAGQEARMSRFAVVAPEQPFGMTGGTAISDFQVQLDNTPRYLTRRS